MSADFLLDIQSLRLDDLAVCGTTTGFRDAFPQPLLESSPYELHFSGERSTEQNVMDLASYRGVVFIADLQDEEQGRACIDFADRYQLVLEGMPEDSPPCVLILVLTSQCDDSHFDVLSQAISAGFDDVFTSPLGTELSFLWRVQNVFMRKAREARLQDEACSSLQKDIWDYENLQHQIQHILWEYLPLRCHRQHTPHTDTEIDISTISSIITGDSLGVGAYGKVYRSVKKDDLVVKMIEKTSKRSYHDMVILENALAAMKELRSPTSTHRNISKLHSISHTATHLCFTMDFGGIESLKSRLQSRDSRELPVSKVTSIIEQLLDVVSFMHLEHRIAHRDLKPECIAFSETMSTATVTIVDLDMAYQCRHLTEEIRDGVKVGTFPYMAPEVSLESRYNPFAADIWSVGVVCMEILCFCGLIESLAPSCKRAQDLFRDASVTDDALELSLRPELRQLLEVAKPLLAHTVISRNLRWSSQRLRCCQMPSSVC